MTKKRDVLAILQRDELPSAAGRQRVDMTGRREKEPVVEALAEARKVNVETCFSDLSSDRLQERFSALGPSDGGLRKAGVIARIAGGAPADAARPGNADQARLPASA